VLPVVEKIFIDMAGKPRSTYGRPPKVVCLSPTRELARQIAKEFDLVAPSLKAVCVYGGAPYTPQENALKRGVDVVIGTPGRVIDMLDRNCLKLSDIKYVILDEADEMLNIGFADAVDKILASAPKPEERQTLLFSATIPPWVQGIAQKHMRPSNLITVDLVGNSKLKAALTVRHLAICCPPPVRISTMADVVKVYAGTGRTIVFANTKAEVNELAMKSSISNGAPSLSLPPPASARAVALCVRAGDDTKFIHLTSRSQRGRSFSSLAHGAPRTRSQLIPSDKRPTQHRHN